jgi:hypothetical protein
VLGKINNNHCASLLFVAISCLICATIIAEKSSIARTEAKEGAAIINDARLLRGLSPYMARTPQSLTLFVFGLGLWIAGAALRSSLSRSELSEPHRSASQLPVENLKSEPRQKRKKSAHFYQPDGYTGKIKRFSGDNEQCAPRHPARGE